jgi:hypothetical protein
MESLACEIRLLDCYRFDHNANDMANKRLPEHERFALISELQSALAVGQRQELDMNERQD